KSADMTSNDEDIKSVRNQQLQGLIQITGAIKEEDNCGVRWRRVREGEGGELWC
ncbi:hypothetical protein A2U01_0095536, partial [Trifolium medium]|nr:hypothetical protein [Trifolium medium]